MFLRGLDLVRIYAWQRIDAMIAVKGVYQFHKEVVFILLVLLFINRNRSLDLLRGKIAAFSTQFFSTATICSWLMGALGRLSEFRAAVRFDIIPCNCRVGNAAAARCTLTVSPYTASGAPALAPAISAADPRMAWRSAEKVYLHSIGTPSVF